VVIALIRILPVETTVSPGSGERRMQRRPIFGDKGIWPFIGKDGLRTQRP